MVLRDASDICLWFTYIERVAKQGLHTSSTTQRREATFWFIMHCITTTVTQIRYMYYSNLELCVTCHAGCTLKVCHCKEGSPPRTCSIINCQSEKPSPLPLWLHTTIAQFQRHAGNNTRWNVFILRDLLRCLELRDHVIFIGTEPLKPAYRHLKHVSEGRPDLVVVRQYISTIGIL